MKSEIKKNLFPLVLTVKEELEKQKINFWVDMGSLLGIIRDKKLLEWDHDFDFSIFSEDREKIINVISSLKKKGLIIKVEKNFPWLEDIVQIYDLSLNKKLHVDIGIYTKIGNIAFMRRSYAAYGKFSIFLLDIFRKFNHIKPQREISSKKKFFSMILVIYKYFFVILNLLIPNIIKLLIGKIVWKTYVLFGKCKSFSVPLVFFDKFTTVELYGEKFKAPHDYQNYLIFWYSKNWTIPQKDWNILNAKGCLITKYNKYNKYIENIQLV